MNKEESLVSLAMLKVNADTQGRDYLDYFVPFACFVLDKYRPDPVTDSGIQLLLRQEFGLNLPIQAVELVLRRLAKRRLLKCEHHVYQISGPIPSGQTEERRTAARRQQSVVVNQLREFAQKNHNITWSEVEAIDALLAYLQRFSIECLRSFVQGAALPEIPTSDDRHMFLVGAFIKYALEYKPEVFECIVIFVKGNMLANALLCTDLASMDRKFSSVVFYLDTTLVMWLFKLWSEYHYSAASELVDQLKNLKGTVAVFDHTVAEIQRVLLVCETHIDDINASAWRMITVMRKAGIKKSDIAFLRATLKREFNALGIVQHNTPGYIEQFQIDEKLLEKALDEDIHYLNPKALQDDINSIRSIYALRKGKHALHLEDCGAVLVTTNTALAEAAFHFGRTHESSCEVSPVITEFSLSNIAWLKAPLRAPDLPRFELVADCYATLEPSGAIWTKYLAEIDRLKKRGNISAEEHELLRSSLVAREELMNLTLGSEAALTEQTITEIAERVKADLVKDRDVIIAAERASHAVTKSEHVRLQRQNETVRKQVYDTTEKLGRWLGRGVIGGLVVLLLAASAFSAFWTKSLAFGSWWLSFVAVALIMIAVIWPVVSGFSGMSFNELAKRVEQWCQAELFRVIMKHLYPGENERKPPTSEPVSG